MAEKGFLDLSGWDFASGGIAHLDGQWIFYRQQLLTPGDLNGPRPPETDETIGVPGFWPRQESIGHATCVLRLRVDPRRTDLALRMGDVNTAYRLWVNGKRVAEVGVVGVSRAAETPKTGYRIVPIEAAGGELTLVLQISNYHNNYGGVADTIKMGPEEDLRALEHKTFGYGLLVSGALIVMGVYHLLLFLIRLKDYAILYFGLLCLELGVWFLASSGAERFLLDMLPMLTTQALYRVDLITFYLSVPTGLMFIHRLFPREAVTAALRLFQILVAPFVLVVLFTPDYIFSHSVIPYYVVTLLAMLYSIRVFTMAVHRKRDGSLWFLAGFLIFCVTAVNDILYANRLIQTGYVIPFGILALVVSQSFILALKFFKAFATVETLSRDLSEKNIALSRMDRIKDEFLANTSHELRTPLNGIIGLAESIRDGALGRVRDNIRDNLELIVKSGRRLSGLINDLLDLSRLKNRELTLTPGPVDIRALTDTVLSVSGPLIGSKALVLKNRIPGDIPFVYGDELRLQQILYNLVGNAIKFTNRGEVRVSAAREGAMVAVSVSDTGIGIAEADFEKIFESFEQVQGAASRPFQGTGLGLAITRQLVKLHGGVIRVSSAPNRGTTFSFTLPVSEQRPDPDPGVPAAAEVSFAPDALAIPSLLESVVPGDAGTLENILVVDDDPINLQVVKNQLSLLENCRIIPRLSGPEALEWIETEGRPDLLLLDIMMPGMTGYEVCRILRQVYSAHELPIIILTARNRMTDLVEGFACGANDYLTKPFSRDELLARVRTQLDLKRAYGIERENLRLKKEIRQRELTELDLRMMQKRLSRILDSLEEAILAVNQDMEIAFCNAGCEALLQYDAEGLLGRPVGDLFVPNIWKEAGAAMEEMMAGDNLMNRRDLFRSAVLLRRDMAPVPCHIRFARLDMDDEPLLVLLLDDAKKKNSGSRDRIPAQSFFEELNRSRQRVRFLEEYAAGPGTAGRAPVFGKELKEIDTTLSYMEKKLTGARADADRKRLGVRVMNLSLEYWAEATGATKVDLAGGSGLWKVYMNRNGFERTQTLDKYLDIGSFPKVPRWRRVFQTADFVLLTCKSESTLRAELETALSRLRMLSPE